MPPRPTTSATAALNNVDQRSVIDAGFLELTRLGELPRDDPDVQASLSVVDSVLECQTASGPGWHRYGIKASGATDGYGDCYEPDPTNCSPTGEPWFTHGRGSGHLWPLLDGERAEQDLQAGDTAGAAAPGDRRCSGWPGAWACARAGLGGPRHVPASPYGSDPTTASIGFINGKAAGSADAADLGPGPVPAAGARPRRPGACSTSRRSRATGT